MAEKFKNKYRIEPNRWQFWDYSVPASYFITICTANRKCILGNIKNGKMILSECGKIVETEIRKIPQYHKRALLDVSVIMPNHIHCIITLGDYDFDNGISSVGGGVPVKKNHEFSLPHPPDVPVKKIHEFSLPQQSQYNIKQYRKQRRRMIIPKILGKLQQQTSKKINIMNGTPGKKNWQKDYYDHVIRNNKSYQNIYNYILKNPKKWDEDKFYNK